MHEKYAKYYNRHARHKEFDVGQKVLILTPDTTHKAFAQWLGPATILDKTSMYGYIVDHEGVRKHIHAVKLRPYCIRVKELTCDISAVSTVCDTDECVTISTALLMTRL
jgi:hypothetical protein